MKITCKYQVLLGQVQVQAQVLWHIHTPSTQVHQVLINMYLSRSTKYKYCTHSKKYHKYITNIPQIYHKSITKCDIVPQKCDIVPQKE